MIHIHRLDGCAPAPLAHYLKALGVLRLVSEQADPAARGWWEGERFCLATVLDREALIAFFRDTCSPLPAFNPWGGRSGYFPDSSEKTARNALVAIERSSASRLASFQGVIASVRSVIKNVSDNKKPADDAKGLLIGALRGAVQGEGVAWLDSVAALLRTRDGDLVSVYPSLLGTGGNEGSGSYTSAYMRAVVECIEHRRHDASLPAILFGEHLPAVSSDKIELLQLLPEGDASPWELILAIAGASLVRSSVVTRQGAEGSRWTASPFFVAPTSSGYASAARLDEFALKQGNELAGRGEQWFPLWSHPMSHPELTHLFAEGRAMRGRRRADDGWSMARAVAGMGVCRGISVFVRYGYLQRNNQASHFAVPLGSFAVSDAPEPRLDCLDDLDDWFVTLHRFARDKDGSTRLRVAERRVSSSMFEACQRASEPARWQSLLLALSEVESVMRTGSGFKAQPVPPLRPEWVSAADDGSSEFRLALSLALQAARFERHRPIVSVRRHWLPLGPKGARVRFAVTGDTQRPRLEMRSEVVMSGRDGIDDAIALVQRRLLDATRAGERCFSLQPAPRAAAALSDVSAWLAGTVDADRTLALARALMALDRRLWAEQYVRPSAAAPAADMPDDAWVCLRLAHLPWPLRDRPPIPIDPAIFRRLAAGDASGALDAALRRLRAAGLRPGVRATAIAPATARRWAAALAFPISPHSAARLALHLCPTHAQELSA